VKWVGAWGLLCKGADAADASVCPLRGLSTRRCSPPPSSTTSLRQQPHPHHALVSMSRWISIFFSKWTGTSRSTVMPSCAGRRGAGTRMRQRVKGAALACWEDKHAAKMLRGHMQQGEAGKGWQIGPRDPEAPDTRQPTANQPSHMVRALRLVLADLGSQGVGKVLRGREGVGESDERGAQSQHKRCWSRQPR